MDNTMTLTKAVAGLCGALLIFLLIGWAGEGVLGAGHGLEQQAYRIDTGDDDSSAPAEAEEEVPFADLLAAADPDKGASVFRQCQACHKLDGTNSTGPHLDGVVGRAVASVDGFNYDDAMHSLGGDWTPERLSEFLANPKAYAPGTKMTFAGLRKDTDRANLIAYLSTQGH